MTKIHCSAELKIGDEILRCKFRGEDGCCTKEEIEVGEDEELASCYGAEWVKIE